MADRDLKRLLDSGTVQTVDDLLDAAPIGHNQPPEQTPFEIIKGEIDDLYGEAKNWLDGEPIANEAQAGEIGKLRGLLTGAKKRADEQRKAEAKPFDDAKKEVQDRYNPLIKDGTGIVDRAVAACNSALAPWLKRIDDEQRAAALKLREDADKVAREALGAAQAAASSGDLGQRERAEDLLAQAKSTVTTMKHAEKAKPQVATGGRAIGMKSVYVAELTDPAAAIEYYRKMKPAALKEWMLEQAAADVRAGPKPPPPIPGFAIREDRVPA